MTAPDDPQELASEPFDYSLVRIGAGHFVLRVVANQSAFYYRKDHELSPAEVEKYRSPGKPYLERLARRVRYEP